MPVLECPTCRKTVTYVQRDEIPYRPFCSHRCKMIDLSRWLNEEFRVSEEMPEHLRAGSDIPIDLDLED